MSQAIRWLSAAFVALPLAVHAQHADVPYLTGRVVDNAEIMKPDTRRRLADLLQAHERETTNQVVVLTVATLHGESVEDYAVRVFEQWKLGQKGQDNGVLVVVVPQDRRMRIERRIVTVESRAIAADDLVLVAHVAEDARVAEGRAGAGAHEFLGADFDHGNAWIVVKVGYDVVRHARRNLVPRELHPIFPGTIAANVR